MKRSRHQNQSFEFPMKKYERVLGLVYLPVHAVCLPFVTALLCSMFLPEMTPAYVTLIYYTVSCVITVVLMFGFLKTSFSDLIDGFWRGIQAVILGYALYYALIWVTSFLLTRIMSEINPNSQALMEGAKINFDVVLVISAVLAPVVEETLFRGALFGTIRKKSRIAAYVVSALLFSVYHLWQSAAAGAGWAVLLYIPQYIPASIALAWCYERGGTIWSPILMHSAANLIATTLSRK